MGRPTQIVALAHFVAAAVLFAFTVPLLPHPALAAQPSAESLYQDARKGYYSLLGSKKRMANRAEWMGVIAKFDKIAITRPDHPRGKDALFTAGQLYAKLADVSGLDADRSEARARFERVVSRHPKSPLAKNAQRQIDALRAPAAKARGTTVSQVRAKSAPPSP
ncbi:MAG: hypothetical protein HQK87_03515, partial [Nitrospinae bacterium]|nr:hypothetical protein [Nitrospinota bacterium]